MANLLCGRRPVGTVAYIGGAIGLSDFHWSFTQLVAMWYEYFAQPGTYLHIDRSTAGGQIQARNELCVKMQGDWLLQIDSDHRFDPDLLFRMLQLFEGEKLDVLVGMYNFKNEPHNPVLWTWADGAYKNMVEWGSESGKEIALLPISAAGAGCLLVRRSVFLRLQEEFGAHPFSPYGTYTTDDFAFFEKCRLLGIKCFCAPAIECDHLAITGYGMKDFDRESVVGATTVAQEMRA